jgi:hypothetical protein
MLNKRNEPIPANAISLSAAFRKFIERFENLSDLEDQAEESLHCIGGPYKLDHEAGEWKCSNLPQLGKYDLALRQAELSFRKWLTEDGPTAFVLDPQRGREGEEQSDPHRGWLQIDNSKWLHGCNFLPGIHEDFVSPDDLNMQGPSDAQFDGDLSKVFFDAGEFERKSREWRVRGHGARTSRTGRNLSYDWSGAQSEAMRLMDHHGDFSVDDREWDRQARLEEAIRRHFEARLGPDHPPSEKHDPLSCC